jgi:RNA polymerase sigma-70 factor (ECF subfamily)
MTEEFLCKGECVDRRSDHHIQNKTSAEPWRQDQGVYNRQQEVQPRSVQSVYQEQVGPIYSYIYRRIGNREDAEDLTSQVFIKAVHNLDLRLDPLQIQKWLFQVARTIIADHWRLYYRASINSLEEMLDIGWEGPQTQEMFTVHDAFQEQERVQRLLTSLSEQYRDVLINRFLLNLSIKETAQKMHITEANVKVLQFRALKRAADLEQSLSE